MNILHVVQGYAPALGGSEYRVQRISEILVREHGDCVTVLCPDGHCCDDFNLPDRPRLPSGAETSNGVRVVRARTWRGGTALLEQAINFAGDGEFAAHLRHVRFGPRMPALPWHLLTGNWDVVMATTFPCLQMPVSAWLKPLAGYPLVLVGAYHDRDPLHRHPYTWRYARLADAYVAHTPFERDLAIRNGIAAEKVHLIAAGSDPDFTAGCDRAAARAGYGIDGTVLLYVGQFIPGKGIETILAAAAQLNRTRQDFSLIIAGSASHPHAAHIRALVAALPESLSARVVVRGNFPAREKAAIFAAADVFVFPSTVDSFGIAITEAWAAGLPVIAAAAPPQQSFLRAATDALLVPPENPAALAAALSRLLDSPAERAALAGAGRQRVHDHYNWPAVTIAYRQLYSKLAATRRRPGGRE